MAVTVPSSLDTKTRMLEAGICQDGNGNVIERLSVHGDYCLCVYVVLVSPRSQLHGPVIAFTRRDAFKTAFGLIAECMVDWIGNQRKHPGRCTDALFASVALAQPMLGALEQPPRPMHLRGISRHSLRSHPNTEWPS
jgi:hypothetical protein